MLSKKTIKLTGSTIKLRLCIVGFVFALVIPVFILVKQTLSQLKWESFHQNRVQAEALVSRIEEKLNDIILLEEERAIGEYQFLVVTGKIENSYVQRSVMSQLPIPSSIPGIMGYFQLDGKNHLSSPLVPSSEAQALLYGLSRQEYQQRVAKRDELVDILVQNKLVSKTISVLDEENSSQVKPYDDKGLGATQELTRQLSDKDDKKSQDVSLKRKLSRYRSDIVSQSAFDNLNSKNKLIKPQSNGRIEDLKLDYDLQNKSVKERVSNKGGSKIATLPGKRLSRKEQSVIAQSINVQSEVAEDDEGYTESREINAPIKNVNIQIFESEIEPFQVSLLKNGLIVVYRRVWTENQRVIQGFLVNQSIFFKEIFEKEYINSTLFGASRLALAYQGDLLTTFIDSPYRNKAVSSSELSGTLLLQKPLSPPFDNFELVFSIQDLSVGVGSRIVLISAFVLLLVIVLGAWLFYRYALAQMKLMNQQQDFVSSVSHELKTPLTSIRMYGEILREGWAAEGKRKEYYDFIYFESERLSRLINNVLQLANLTRNKINTNMLPHSIGELSDIVKSKLSSQVERAGFTLNIHIENDVEGVLVNVDEDMFTQIMINLIDNAIKYSAKEEVKKIDIGFYVSSTKKLNVSVRDYGPGVEDKQLKKIFTLFYRNENELTRETKGTGIGLALVSQYANLMGAKVDVINKKPGVEVMISLSSIKNMDAK